MAERLAICLSLPASERALFLAVAQGKRPVSFLTLSETPKLPQPPLDQLPRTGTPFIGREAELAAVAALLASPDVRLLTILGPGGMGKTRLALAAADAERTRQPRHVPSTAWSSSIWLRRLRPTSSRRPSPQRWAWIWLSGAAIIARRCRKLLDFLRPRRLLLILDNFEHLLAAGSASLAPRHARGRAGSQAPGHLAAASQPAGGTPVPAVRHEIAAACKRRTDQPSAAPSSSHGGPATAAGLQVCAGRGGRSWPASASRSRACRWRWNWQRPGSIRFRWAALPTNWAPASTCWRPI